MAEKCVNDGLCTAILGLSGHFLRAVDAMDAGKSASHHEKRAFAQKAGDGAALSPTQAEIHMSPLEHHGEAAHRYILEFKGAGAPEAARLLIQVFSQSDSFMLSPPQKASSENDLYRRVEFSLSEGEALKLKVFTDKLNAYFSENSEADGRLLLVLSLSAGMEYGFPPLKANPVLTIGADESEIDFGMRFHTNNPKLIQKLEGGFFKVEDVTKSWRDSGLMPQRGGKNVIANWEGVKILERLMHAEHQAHHSDESSWVARLLPGLATLWHK